MNIFLRELINRIVTYLIMASKGESYEEKIEHLLKKSLLITFMAIILACTMTSKFLVAGWYLEDLENSFSKIDKFMVTQQENMNQLFRVNNDQYATVVRLTKENKEFIQDNRRLVKEHDELLKENERLVSLLKSKGK